MHTTTHVADRRRECEAARLEREIRVRLRDAVSAEQERRYLAILEALHAPNRPDLTLSPREQRTAAQAATPIARNGR